MHEGRASLTTALINSLGYGIMMFSAYKPTAWFGGLLALTMAVAFLAEVFVVPAVIMLLPRLSARRGSPPRVPRRDPRHRIARRLVSPCWPPRRSRKATSSTGTCRSCWTRSRTRTRVRAARR